jgi:hypothetical protein
MRERKPDDESISRVLRIFPERAQPAGWRSSVKVLADADEERASKTR